jgi:ribosomal protein L1
VSARERLTFILTSFQLSNSSFGVQPSSEIDQQKIVQIITGVKQAYQQKRVASVFLAVNITPVQNDPFYKRHQHINGIVILPDRKKDAGRRNQDKLIGYF